jgi:hypothetical protein
VELITISFRSILTGTARFSSCGVECSGQWLLALRVGLKITLKAGSQAGAWERADEQRAKLELGNEQVPLFSKGGARDSSFEPKPWWKTNLLKKGDAL